MVTIAPIKNRENQINASCAGTKFKFVSWVDGYKNASSKFTCLCADHGPWDVSVHNFINGGRRCPGCQKQKTSERCRTPEKELIERINSIRPGYVFVGWVKDFKGTKSKFWCKCPTHGNWAVSPLHYVYQGTGCPSCAGLKPYTKQERESQLKRLCLDAELSFAGWEGPYKNSNSRFCYECPTHGINVVSINTFINGGRRCPGCAVSGFKAELEGFLYMLAADGAIKVGITNNLTARLAILRRATPFPFTVLKTFSASGASVRELEKHFHASFESAGLSGFDGATEWMTFNQDLIDEFSQLETNTNG